MKILAIHGCPRGSQSRTLQLLNGVTQGARDAGAEVELVDVCQLKIGYCTGCGACHATGKCVRKDDFPALAAKMMASEGLILASPNYFRSVTAQLKTMIDRMADVIHCQLFVGKYGCSVATAGGPAFREVTDYLNGILIGFGANAVGAVGASPNMPGSMAAAEKEAVALGRTLVEAIRTKRTYPDQEAIHAQMRRQFKQLVAMNKDLWKHEFQYWQTLGEA